MRDCKIYLFNKSQVEALSSRYTVYQGDFVCHTCKARVGTIRHYFDEQFLTWVCLEKHLSKVSLNTRKNREHYERKERK